MELDFLTGILEFITEQYTLQMTEKSNRNKQNIPKCNGGNTSTAVKEEQTVN
jgi:hypothetical protein